MQNISHVNISIIGFGNVGRCIANILIQESQRRYHINIMDPSEQVMGSVLDINHSVALAGKHQITFGDEHLLSKADFIFFCAGKAIPSNKTREWGLEENVAIVQSVFGKFKPRPACVIITLVNPVEAIAKCILKFTDHNPENILGVGTIVDAARLAYELSIVSGVGRDEINTMVVGEHGETMVPVLSSTRINGKPIEDVIDQELINMCIYEARRGAQRVKETQGATYYAASNAAVCMMNGLLRGSDCYIPICIYDKEEGIYYSLPVELVRGKMKPMVLDLSTSELQALEESIEKIQMTTDKALHYFEMNQLIS